MEKYNYQQAVIDDIKQYINDNNIIVTEKNRDDIYDNLYDDLVNSDSVTGNASGSYTFSTWQAEENLCHNWDLMEEAGNELGYDSDVLARGAEYLDVMIRFYLVGQLLGSVLDEIQQDEPDDEDGEDE